MNNRLIDVDQNNMINQFVKTDDILKDMCGIIESSQKAAYQAVNMTLVKRNWLLGYRIASEEMQDRERAKYGAEIIKNYLQSMEKDLQKPIYMRFIHFIKCIRRFSRHRLENLKDCYHGRTTQCCYR